MATKSCKNVAGTLDEESGKANSGYRIKGEIEYMKTKLGKLGLT